MPIPIVTARPEAGTGQFRHPTALSINGLDIPDPRQLGTERNDGLLFVDEMLPFDGGTPSGTGETLSIDLGAVDWQPFLYLAHVELWDSGKAVAHAGAVFEVFRKNAWQAAIRCYARRPGSERQQSTRLRDDGPRERDLDLRVSGPFCV